MENSLVVPTLVNKWSELESYSSSIGAKFLFLNVTHELGMFIDSNRSVRPEIPTPNIYTAN